MAQLTRLVAPLLALLLAGSAGLAADAPKALVGRVVSIVDGDTIKVRIGDHTETVRYIGMNAPELHHPTKGEEPGGREAAEANRKLVGGQTVRVELDVQERDRYARLLAYVYLGDMMVNAELVAQGYAQVMTIPPNVKYQDLLLKNQREARLLQLGLWKDTSLPLSPGASPGSSRPQAVAQTKPNPAAEAQQAQGRPGVPPQDAWTCPLTNPIKGNFTTYSGERCIYHMQGSEFFGKTKPERCYATEADAVKDGCRRSKR
jgi:micrococcal nuclease